MTRTPAPSPCWALVIASRNNLQAPRHLHGIGERFGASNWIDHAATSGRADSPLVDDADSAPPSRLEVILGLSLLPSVLVWDLLRALGRGVRHGLILIGSGATRLVVAVRRLGHRILRAPVRWSVAVLRAVSLGLSGLLGWLAGGLRALGRWVGAALGAFGRVLQAPVRWLAGGLRALGRWVGAALGVLGRVVQAPLRWLAGGLRALGRWPASTLLVIGRALAGAIRWSAATARSYGRALWTPLSWVGTGVGRGIGRLAVGLRRRRQRMVAGSRKFARRVRVAVPRPRIRRR